MAFTRTWDETAPADATAANLLGQDIRQFKQDLRERLEQALVASFSADPLVFNKNIPSGSSFRQALGNVSGAVGINLASGTSISLTQVGATTLSISGLPTNPDGTVQAVAVTMRVVNGGNFTFTWWAGIKWPSGTAPTLSTNGTDMLTIYTDDGATWYGVLWGRAMA